MAQTSVSEDSEAEEEVKESLTDDEARRLSSSEDEFKD